MSFAWILRRFEDGEMSGCGFGRLLGEIGLDSVAFESEDVAPVPSVVSWDLVGESDLRSLDASSSRIRFCRTSILSCSDLLSSLWI